MHGQTDNDRQRGAGGGEEMVRNLLSIGEAAAGKKPEMEAAEIDSNLIGR